MKLWRWAAFMATMMTTAGIAGAEASREQIEQGIDTGVKYLVSKQTPEGRWVYGIGTPDDKRYHVGTTALVVLALQHSGSRSPEAALAIKKGISYILQQPPEPSTYTGGVVEQVLFNAGASEYRRAVATYAWMLCGGQLTTGADPGGWDYLLPSPGGDAQSSGLGTAPVTTRWDHSNTQFGILGLVYADKCGYQVPRVIWERAAQHYIHSQHKDGGWDYQSDAWRAAGGKPDALGGKVRATMTLAGTVSIYLCDEMLADKRHAQCKTPPVDEAYEAGLKWVGDHWGTMTYKDYGWYGCERLGILIGYSEIGGHDWYQEGAADILPRVGRETKYSTNVELGGVADVAFQVLFLARGRNPIIINKLKREGDWNLHRYDINHLIEHISGPWQIPCQWRIVTLNAKMDMLLKTPILWISGHEALTFTPEEKAKLKEYVEKGGTILGEDCCSKKPFDESFKALLKELWPDNELTDLPKSHAIFTSFRKLESPPELQAMAMNKGQGRLGVIYIPHGISCRWEVGGSGAKSAMDAGACIYLYVEKIGKQIKTETK